MANTLRIQLKEARNLKLITFTLHSFHVRMTIVTPSFATDCQESKVVYGKNVKFDEKEYEFNVQDAEIDDCDLLVEVFCHSPLWSKAYLYGKRRITLRDWKKNLESNKTFGLRFALNDCTRGWLDLNMVWNGNLTELEDAETKHLFDTLNEETQYPGKELNVKGDIPEWINGTLFSQISGQWEFGKTKLDHLFDGPAMIAKLVIKDKKVTFMNKYLKSDYREKSNALKRLNYITFALEPDGVLFTPNRSSMDRVNTLMDSNGESEIELMPTEDDSEFESESVEITIDNYPFVEEQEELIPECRSVALSDTLELDSDISTEKPPLLRIFKPLTLKFNKLSGWFYSYANNANVCIEAIGTKSNRKLIATTDVPFAVQFDPESLETVKSPFKWNYDKSVGSSVLTPAHSCYHPRRKEYFNIVTGLHLSVAPLQHTFVRYSDENRINFGSIRAKVFPNFFHSFALSDKFMVLIEQPYCVDLAAFMMKLPVIESFEYNNCKETIFRVLSLETGTEYATFSSAAFTYYHIGNAFEREDNGQIHLYIDIIAYDEPDSWNLFIGEYLDNYTKSNRSTLDIVYKSKLKRIRLPLPKEHSEITIPLQPSDVIVVNDAHIEMPTINPNFKTRPNKYLYGNGIQSSQSTYLDAIVKIDMEDGKEIKRWHQEHMYPGETLFIQKPGQGTKEDEGVLISLVRDLSDNVGPSFLLVLDAQTFDEIARAETPFHIPAGIHGTFVDENID